MSEEILNEEETTEQTEEEIAVEPLEEIAI
jgi:hypothetical protein